MQFAARHSVHTVAHTQKPTHMEFHWHMLYFNHWHRAGACFTSSKLTDMDNFTLISVWRASLCDLWEQISAYECGIWRHQKIYDVYLQYWPITFSCSAYEKMCRISCETCGTRSLHMLNMLCTYVVLKHFHCILCEARIHSHVPWFPHVLHMW